MYMVGGGSTRVHRGNRTYPGARRFLQPPKPPIDWRRVVGNVFIGLCFAVAIIPLLWMMVAMLG